MYSKVFFDHWGQHSKVNLSHRIISRTRPKASGSSSRFKGGGVTGKGQDRDKTGTRQGHDRGFRGLKKFSGGWWW